MYMQHAQKKQFLVWLVGSILLITFLAVMKMTGKMLLLVHCPTIFMKTTVSK
jgi:hypothetical protein